MIGIGEYNLLKVLRETPQGIYLDDGKNGILLPGRFVPAGVRPGDELNVFVYHDKEGRLICTTQSPKGVVGDILKLKVVGTTPQGAFLDNGLMKDIFVPKSKQLNVMAEGNEHLVMIYLDELTSRLCATERIDSFLSNEQLTVKPMEDVDLIVFRKTNIGYQVIINNKHVGVLHFNDVYRDIHIGDQFKGYIKNILPGNKIDVAAGKAGFKRVEDEAQKIIRLLKENDGFLPYHDKSSPEEIYSFFSMSKKTFKMTVGGLYKQKLIILEDKGIRLVN